MAQNSISPNINFEFTNVDPVQLLPSIFQQNPFFVDYLTADNILWNEDVFPLIKQLAEVRQLLDYDTKQIKDDWLLVRQANLLGYKFFSDFLSQGNYLLLNDSINRYYEVAGTQQFQNFLGYIKNTTVEIVQLWSQIGIDDYTYFEDPNYIDPNFTVLQYFDDRTGLWYPTSHYHFKYNATFANGLIDEKVITELFYNLAPIHYVLERIIATFDFPKTMYLAMSRASRQQFNGNSSFHLDPVTFGGSPVTLDNILVNQKTSSVA